MQKERREFPRVLVFDALGESTWDKLERIDTYPVLCQRLAEDPAYFQIAYNGHRDGLTQEEDFDRCCLAVACCYDVLFVVEEADKFAPPGRSTAIRPPFLALIEYGRHREISLWCATRFAGRLNQILRSQANRIVSFVQIEPAHRKWIEEAIGSELADKLPHLGQYEAIVWRDGFAIRGTPGSRHLDSRSRLL